MIQLILCFTTKHLVVSMPPDLCGPFFKWQAVHNDDGHGDCKNVGNDKQFFKSLRLSDKTKVYNYVSIQKGGNVLK